MARFDVISDICPNIESVIRKTAESEGFDSIRFCSEIPGRENLKALPAINIFICSLKFAQCYRERTDRVVRARSSDGRLIEVYQDAPAVIVARVAVSAHARNQSEENVLLGLCVKAMLENPSLAPPDLTGDSFGETDRLEISPDPEAGFNDAMSLWKTIGREMKTTLFYEVRFRIESDRRSKEVRRVRTRDISMNPAH